MSTGVIRAYEARDREAVRHICFVTGYMGDPIAWQWRDAESFADLFTSWYTDHEPESALVVEQHGQVVGYLLGCRDTRRSAPPIAAIRHHILRRGLLVRPGTARVLWRAAADLAPAALRRRLPPADLHDDRWPAHLHIDLLPEARGEGAGRQLIARWLDTLRTEEIAGCHLGTWAKNDEAIAFFRAMGFETRGDPTPMPGIRAPDGTRHHTQLMVQGLR